MDKNIQGLILLFSLLTSLLNAQRIQYLNGIQEGEICEFEYGKNGTCQKVSECAKEYEAYQNNEKILKVCSSQGSELSDIICCPYFESTNKKNIFIKNEESNGDADMLDFDICRREVLKYQNNQNKMRYSEENIKSEQIGNNQTRCEFQELIQTLGKDTFYSKLVAKGSRSNMAAIGWTQFNGDVEYKCGGAIITERFIVTVAHCQLFNRKHPDLVRLGDRFLLTNEDDDTAQQLEIEMFISHPDYKFKYQYNDVGMIKTAKKINFNKFVLPSCIDDLNLQELDDWTVAGYGETEKRVQSNILLEINVELVSYRVCNKTYEHDPSLPHGILQSQFCVKSKPIGCKIPDTCYGDSGSPLQYQRTYEVSGTELNRTISPDEFNIPVVLGVVSFGLDCGLNIPSVYTRLAHFKDWMRMVIKRY